MMLYTVTPLFLVEILAESWKVGNQPESRNLASQAESRNLGSKPEHQD